MNHGALPESLSPAQKQKAHVLRSKNPVLQGGAPPQAQKGDIWDSQFPAGKAALSTQWQFSWGMARRDLYLPPEKPLPPDTPIPGQLEGSG